jgi:hypothetical protein
MQEFLQRAYRIVTDEASDFDLELTFIHACLAHVLVVSVTTYLSSKCIFYIGCSKNDQQIYR